jgi:CDP-diacylglycerol--serine O-phosphatidyltransferase
MKDAKRISYFLPNIFTALNMACGFVSILLSFRGEFYPATMFLVLGGIFDLVDGRLARILGTASAFGEQFDSLSDMVTFGLAPSFLVHNVFFKESGRVGQLVPFLFLLCGALRLARFNANIEKISSVYFQGLPIPASAMSLAGIVLLNLEYPRVGDYIPFLLVYVLVFSFLMISNIPFYSFKNSEWARRNKRLLLLFIFITFGLLIIQEKIMILAIVQIYVLSCLFYFITHRAEFKGIFNPELEKDSDDEHH